MLLQMKHTTHFSKITREEYVFTSSEIIRALMRDNNIPQSDSKRKRVELELCEDEAYLTLVYSEDEPEKKAGE